MCGILLRGMKKTWPIFEVGGGGGGGTVLILTTYVVRGGGGGRCSYYMEWPIKSNLTQLSV